MLDFKPAAMDGDQVADVLAKEQPNLPVVISSNRPDDVPESLRWFADTLLQKRDDPDALLLAIEKLIPVKRPITQTASRVAIGARTA